MLLCNEGSVHHLSAWYKQIIASKMLPFGSPESAVTAQIKFKVSFMKV